MGANTPRKTRGKPFGPSNPGVPFKPGNRGKPKGARHRTTQAVAEMLDGEAEAITRKCIDKALAGDGIALRLCMERLSPPTKDAPIKFALAPVRSVEDMARAGGDILAAVSSGEISPDEAVRVIGLLGRLRDLIELVDFEARLKAIEGGDYGNS